MAVRVRQRTDRPGWYVIIDHNAKRKKKAFPDKETALRFARTIRERLAEGDFGIAREAQEQMPFSLYYKTWLDDREADGPADHMHGHPAVICRAAQSECRWQSLRA